MTLDQLGELVQIDKVILIDFFELYLFTTFTDEMNRLRIQFAKNLIYQSSEKEDELDQLHVQSGFSSKNDLGRCFAEIEGKGIGEFIQKIKLN